MSMSESAFMGSGATRDSLSHLAAILPPQAERRWPIVGRAPRVAEKVLQGASTLTKSFRCPYFPKDGFKMSLQECEFYPKVPL